jgi:hypothetical protein
MALGLYCRAVRRCSWLPSNTICGASSRMKLRPASKSSRIEVPRSGLSGSRRALPIRLDRSTKSPKVECGIWRPPALHLQRRLQRPLIGEMAVATADRQPPLPFADDLHFLSAADGKPCNTAKDLATRFTAIGCGHRFVSGTAQSQIRNHAESCRLAGCARRCTDPAPHPRHLSTPACATAHHRARAWPLRYLADTSFTRSAKMPGQMLFVLRRHWISHVAHLRLRDVTPRCVFTRLQMACLPADGG